MPSASAWPGSKNRNGAKASGRHRLGLHRFVHPHSKTLQRRLAKAGGNGHIGRVAAAFALAFAIAFALTSGGGMWPDEDEAEDEVEDAAAALGAALANG